jgi:hypothetical protein
MFPFAPLFATILLALSITGSPVVRNSLVTLPVARRLNLSGGTINLLQYDQARAAALKGRSASGDRLSGSISAINKNVFYIAQVGVGSPATTCKLNARKITFADVLWSATDNLIVDTGSSNTWVGANTTYVKTTTSVSTGQPVSVSYGSGFFSGLKHEDIINCDAYAFL